ncbi:MAG: ParA family protein [Porticoccaceae bacterium]|nr:ParA family protein [Porticoccaceae bacterium]
MRSILVVNAKGGCGKSTIATNLAAYYAIKGKSVVLADYDPQESSLDWLAERPADRAKITGIAAHRDGLRVPKNTDYLIMDSPAALHGRPLAQLVRRADAILMPVLPSPIDERAAARFLVEIKNLRRVVNSEVRVATIANRVRDNTLAAGSLYEFMGDLKLPDGKKMWHLAALRLSQNYIRAAERGLSIFEFAPVKTLPDREQWARTIRWLASIENR